MKKRQADDQNHFIPRDTSDERLSMKTAGRFFLRLGTSLLLCFMPFAGRAQDLDAELAKWMAHVRDEASLAELTIPGTHDSGALYESVASTAKCQDLTIAEQLNIGVRYLDIRLRQYGNAMVIHHGAVYQHLNFDDVLTDLTSFLATNASEVVIMEVSREYPAANSTETFEQTFMRYVTNAAYRNYWWREGYVPKLGAVRGKIILLRRFAGSPSVSGGIDATAWQDNQEFTIYDTHAGAINIQDYYRVSAKTFDHKWGVIQDRLKAAQSDTTGTLFINFTSGYRSLLGVPNIIPVADAIDGRLIDYFGDLKAGHIHSGVVISDFITQDMVQEELFPFFYPAVK